VYKAQFFHALAFNENRSEVVFAIYRETDGSESALKVPVDGVNFQRQDISLDRNQIREIITESGLETYANYMVDNIYRIHSAQNTKVMGIINATPDSFFSESRYSDMPENIDKIIASGCGHIDIGGESTMPGSAGISYREEIRRLEPVMEHLSGKNGLYISLDTRHVETAEYFEPQINMVNDVSGNANPELAEFASEKAKDYVLMHTRGTPETMMSMTAYTDLFGEMSYFIWKNLRALQDAGMPPERIVIDPGIGFAKGRKQNYEIIKNSGNLILDSDGCMVIRESHSLERRKKVRKIN
jgi:dihydropteroate synthase